MSMEYVDVIVVGGGQAGIAASEHLTDAGVSHVVLERGRIAERWRSERWDSLVANGPAWHDRFPGMQFAGTNPDSFAGKEDVAAYFAAYVDQIGAPVRTGVEVTSARRRVGRAGFDVETSDGPMQARYLVVATGPFQRPVIPPIVPTDAPVTQLHSSNYKNPAQLPEGAVMVVGAGSSGVQIAEELRRAGREVVLSVGPHDRPPRSYRDRDFCWWLGVLGLWDAETPPEGAEHVTIAVSGARGGHTVDFRALADAGVELVGMTTRFDDGILHIASDLVDNVREGDRKHRELLDAADAYVARNGLDLPEEPSARLQLPDPQCMTEPVTEVDLQERGISAIVWATGFVTDYSWLDVGPDLLDDRGRPCHRRGVATEPGVYFLGLPWLSRRGSSFIWGVWHDAKHVAGHIATQESYLSFGRGGSADPHSMTPQLQEVAR